MTIFVISAPRSGLNWTRFCVEYFYGLRTPGKPLLLDDEAGAPVFLRTHDALLLTKRRSRKEILAKLKATLRLSSNAAEQGARTTRPAGSGAYKLLNPAEMEGHKVLLILRDPLETFVRMARKSYPRFVSYTGNIQFFQRAETDDKMVVYYDEIVGQPEKMFQALEFLGLEPAGDRSPPTLEEIHAKWSEAGQASRALYGRNQWHSGGARTKRTPLDFKFHQRKLSEAQKLAVWRHLDDVLSEPELALIERFRPRS